VVYCPIDFEHTSLTDGLNAVGFGAHRPTFLSWLGVTPYLSQTAIEQTLQYIVSLPRRTRVVFDFVLADEALPPEQQDLSRRMSGVTAGSHGEPWITRFVPNQLVEELGIASFSEVFHLAPELAQQCYFTDRADGLHASVRAQLIRASV
jgi:O-methyltransferase involved in polyketide biosynthesis